MVKKSNSDNSDILLSDLIDKKTAGKILKTFYKIFGIGCNCVDERNVIANIPPTKFCKMTRLNPTGCKRCEACDKSAWDKIAITKKPTLYKCHAGLIDMAIPVIVNDKNLGTIMGGQFLTENVDDEKIITLAEELDIENKQEYLSAWKKIKKINKREANRLIKMLSLVAETVAQTAYSKYLLKMEIAKKELIISLTADVEKYISQDKLYKAISKKIMKFFKADRILIVEFSKNGGYDIKSELKADKSIKSISEVLSKETAQKIMEYWNDIVFNKGEEVTFNSVNSYKIPRFIRKAYNKIGLVSAMTTILYRTEDSVAVVVMGKYNNDIIWTAEDVKGFNMCGRQVNFAINKINLTEKAKLRALREKALLDNLPASAFLKDVNGKFLAVNEAFLAGKHSQEEVIGHDDFDFEPFEIASAFQAEDLEVIYTKKPYKNVRKSVKNGQEKWIESHKSPILDEKGNVIAITGFNNDITAQIMIDKMKKRFLSILSHELRTPLTSIAGSIDLILNNVIGEVDKSGEELLKIAQKNTKKLTTLINNILELESLETNTLSLNFEHVPLKSIILDAVNTFEKPKTAYGIDIVTRIDLHNDMVNVDRQKLRDVFHHLISNAYKFSKIKENVIIEATKKKKSIVVSFTNIGDEIPTTMGDAIFDKYKQGDFQTQTNQTNIGFGLIISKLLLEKMHGTIDYTSENGKTCFFITLPTISTKA